MKFKNILTSLFAISVISTNIYADNTSVEVINQQQKTEINNLNYFGSDLFKGNFKQTTLNTFNSDYLINYGDTVEVRMWGAENFQAKLQVDTMGNIFIPKVGIIKVQNVKNKNLNTVISKKVNSAFKTGVEIYSTLETFKPIQLFLSGNIQNPGLYEGNSTDSIFQFIDKAGGIKKSGTYREITIQRNNKIVKKIDLYNFLLNGYKKDFLFKSGDVIFINNKYQEFSLTGAVERPYIYEFKGKLDLRSILEDYGNLSPEATGLLVERSINKEKKYFKFNISDLNNIDYVKNGDKLIVTSDFFTENISISIQGESKSDKTLLFKDGIYLSDAIKSLSLTNDSDLDNIIVYRKSVAKMQKELLGFHLNKLEKDILHQNNSSMDIAKLTNIEKESALQFIEKARKVKPKGLVSLGKERDYTKFKLEDGDTIYIPKKSDIVFVQGQVSFPSAHVYNKSLFLNDYITKSGGFNEYSNLEEVLVLHMNGEVSKHDLSGWSIPEILINKGDSIVVSQRIDQKNVQLWKDFSKIFYNIAVSTGVLISLF